MTGTGPFSVDRGRTNDESPDRAQMVLITALLLATILVGLALVLNSAIYAENQATRRSGVGGSDAVQFQTQMENDAGSALRAANTDDFGSYGEYESAYEESIAEWGQAVSRSQARRGIAVSVDATSSPYTRGTRVVQDGKSDFEPYESGLVSESLSAISYEHWLVAHDTRVRNVRQTFDPDDDSAAIAVEAEADVEDYILDLNADVDIGDEFDLVSVPFTTAFDTVGDGNSRPDYAYAVYETDSGEMAVTVYDGTSAETCTTDSPEPTLDLAARTFGGDYCPYLEVFTQENLGGSPSGTYDMYYVEGDNAYGTYEFVTDDLTGDLQSDVKDENNNLLSIDISSCLVTGDFDECFPDTYRDEDANGDTGSSTTAPRTEQAIYSVDMDLAMDSGKLTYSRDSIDIAPGDMDEDD